MDGSRSKRLDRSALALPVGPPAAVRRRRHWPYLRTLAAPFCAVPSPFCCSSTETLETESYKGWPETALLSTTAVKVKLLLSLGRAGGLLLGANMHSHDRMPANPRKR
jgi:hypothetical protein